MNKKQILDRAYVAKVLTKDKMRAEINNTIADITYAASIIDIVCAALDYNYNLFMKELEDAEKEAKA